jgi:orotidine-5'-phosphate decarboxylase
MASMQRFHLASKSRRSFAVACVILVLAMIALVIAWPTVVRHVVISELETLTHRKVTIDALEVNPFTGRIMIRGFRVLEREGGSLFAFLIVSTDLSHYHADATAKAQDRRTAAAIPARDPDAIGRDDACGVVALRGALEWARRTDLAVGLLDLHTSADTAGDPSRVVGYGAFALTRGPGAR